jgi:hypothetical protein
MEQRLQALQAQVLALLAEAEAKDKAEDRRHGKHNRGDEIPADLQRRESRIAKLKEAKAALETEARKQAAAVAAERCAKQGKRAKETESAVETAAATLLRSRNLAHPRSFAAHTALVTQGGLGVVATVNQLRWERERPSTQGGFRAAHVRPVLGERFRDRPHMTNPSSAAAG